MSIYGINFGENSNLFSGSSVQNMSTAGNVNKASIFSENGVSKNAPQDDVREKVDVDKYIKNLVKEKGYKKLKQPGGDGDTVFYTSDKFMMAVQKNNDGSTKITFIDNEISDHQIVYNYDFEGHLTQESEIAGTIEVRKEYLPDGSVRKHTFSNGTCREQK